MHSLKKGVGHCIWIGEHFLRCDAYYPNSLLVQPLCSAPVTLRAITEIMDRAIDFDRQLCRGAVEIEHISADRVLPTEPYRKAAQPHPQQLLRQG